MRLIQSHNHDFFPQTRDRRITQGRAQDVTKGNGLVLQKGENFISFRRYCKKENDESESYIPALQWISHEVAHYPFLLVFDFHYEKAVFSW